MTTTRAQNVLISVRGDAPFQGLGASLAVLDDVDGDGVPEIAVGSWGFHTVEVRSGATGAQLWIVQSSDPGFSSFGSRVRAAGDVNGDGHVDVIVPNWESNSYSGAVHVYSGVDGTELYSYFGTTGAQLGQDADGAGDLNHDGYADFVIGIYHEGTAQVRSGFDGSLLLQVTGSGTWSIGAGVAGVGDVNLDGTPDFAVNEPFATGGGRVHVYSGTDGSPLYDLVAPGSTNGGFGETIVRAGDLNGDGRPEIAVGDSLFDGSAVGSVRVYSGLDGSLVRTLTGSGCMGSSNQVQIDPTLGHEIARVGDYDHDGVPDLGVGGWNEAVVFSGATGAELAVFHEPAFFGSPGQVFSTSIGALPDLNGDGNEELVVGWQYANSGYRRWAGRLTWYADAIYPDAGVLLTLGDGSGAACPCGNTGQAGAGCRNSTGFGATLRAHGSTSLGRDTLWFEIEHLPPFSRGILYAATLNANGGLGIPFGGGLRGGDGAYQRFGAHLACSDGRTVWGPGVHQGTPLGPGDTRTFQMWYRDPSGPCGTFSFTNSVRLTLTP